MFVEIRLTGVALKMENGKHRPSTTELTIISSLGNVNAAFTAGIYIYHDHSDQCDITRKPLILS